MSWGLLAHCPAVCPARVTICDPAWWFLCFVGGSVKYISDKKKKEKAKKDHYFVCLLKKR